MRLVVLKYQKDGNLINNFSKIHLLGKRMIKNSIMLVEKNCKWVFDFSRCTSVTRKKRWNDCQLLSFFYS